MTPWGEYFLDLLRQREVSLRTFAKTVGVTHVFLSRVSTGKKPIPRESIEEWATALRLSDAERDRFRRLALLELSPEQIAAEYRELQTRVARLEQQAAEALRRLSGR